MEVYLIRHTTPFIEKGICYEQSDLEVDVNHFESELKIIQEKLPPDFDAVFTSPLQRCTTLAEKMSLNSISDNRLMEINFGEWELKKWNEISKEQLQDWTDDLVHYKPKNGESLLELNTRVEIFIEELLQSNHNKILLVTHAGIIRCFWKYILKIPLKNCMKIPVDFGEVLALHLDKKNGLSLDYSKTIKDWKSSLLLYLYFKSKAICAGMLPASVFHFSLPSLSKQYTYPEDT